MALSYAVIMAAYAAKAYLLTPVRSVMAFTYAVAAYALFARWMTEWIRHDSIHSAIGAIFYFGTRVGKVDNIPT